MPFGASCNTTAQRVLILIFLRNYFFLRSPNSEIPPIYAACGALANGATRNTTNTIPLSVAICLIGYTSTTQCYFHNCYCCGGLVKPAVTFYSAIPTNLLFNSRRSYILPLLLRVLITKLFAVSFAISTTKLFIP